MKKTVIISVSIIVGAIILAFAALVGVTIYKDLKQENKLHNEINQLNILINADTLNKNKIEESLNKTVTTGDYSIVEKAYKQYLTDIYNNVTKIMNILNDKQLITCLSIDNYKKDGPNFINTKNYLKENKQKLENYKNKYYALLDEKRAMSYINATNLDSYYKELYQNEIIGNIEDEKKDETIKNSLNYVIFVIDLEEQVINFLSENSNMWMIENDNIVFENQELLDKYNEFIKTLEEQEIKTKDKVSALEI